MWQVELGFESGVVPAGDEPLDRRVAESYAARLRIPILPPLATKTDCSRSTLQFASTLASLRRTNRTARAPEAVLTVHTYATVDTKNQPGSVRDWRPDGPGHRRTSLEIPRP